MLLIVLGLVIAPAVTTNAATTNEDSQSRPPSTSADAVVARVGDMTVTESFLNGLAAKRLIRLRAEEYNLKRTVLDEYIASLLLESEAKARGLSADQLIQLEIEGKARPVTDEEARVLYETSTDRFPGSSEADALKRIRSNMTQQRIHQRKREFISSLMSRSVVKVLLEPPRIAVDPRGPSRGPENAPVTIVEFSDYQCPFCAKLSMTLKEIVDVYRGQVRLVFRDYPLPIHRDAAKAAEAATCAGDQGRYWEMHDKLFEGQRYLDMGDLRRYAAMIGLDAASFNECLESNRHAGKWENDRRAGSDYGVVSTPTLFVNGRYVGGTVPFEAIAQLVDEELETLGLVSARRSRPPGSGERE
jgi:protein-disulfide isomerase